MRSLLGGYALMKLKPGRTDKGSEKLLTNWTGSSCINDPLVEGWSYSLAGGLEDSEVMRIFSIDEAKLSAIRSWIDVNAEKSIGPFHLFLDLASATSYREKFFLNLADAEIFAI